jgi:hypothetical protein
MGFRGLCSVAALLTLPTRAQMQTFFDSIVGMMTDATGAVLPGAAQINNEIGFNVDVGLSSELDLRPH